MFSQTVEYALRAVVHLAHQSPTLCTTEQMLLHVDTKAQKTTPIRDDVYEALAAIWESHKDLPKPKNVGRTMTVPEPA